MKKLFIAIVAALALALTACEPVPTQEKRDAETSAIQQAQYAASQPVPVFDWSLERHLITQLYQIRNQRVATHSVWRSDHGLIEGDCPSIGFGIPYDTSLTNPLQPVRGHQSLTTIEMAEPNGLFASKNTAATWVMCAGDSGMIEPIYVETKVTVYPYPVTVDYEKNRVTKLGKASVNITSKK